MILPFEIDTEAPQNIYANKFFNDHYIQLNSLPLSFNYRLIFMRTLFFILLFNITLSLNAQTSINSILILGDSYLKGHFGFFLQKEIHDSGQYDVLSIAIGGAGSETFLPPMKNSCCGYRVRQSCANINLEKTKNIEEVEIPILEKAESPTNKVVMQLYGGDLSAIMNTYKPLAVILVLGANKINAHEELLKLIKSYDINIPIVWIGPFNSKISAGRYASIKRAISNQSNCLLVQSDSIVDKLKLVPEHFYGNDAKKLAKAIYKQFEAFLDSSICRNYENITDAMLFYLPDFIEPKKARNVTTLKANNKERINIKCILK